MNICVVVMEQNQQGMVWQQQQQQTRPFGAGYPGTPWPAPTSNQAGQTSAAAGNTRVSQKTKPSCSRHYSFNI